MDANSAGSFDLGGGADVGSLILADNLTITHNGSGILSFTRPITGDKSISVNGSGTTTFSSTAALDDIRYTAGAGILNIAGTVSAKDQIQFTTGTVNVNSGGTLQYTGGDTAISDEVRIGTTSGSAATLNINNGGLVDTGANVLKFGQSGATSNFNLNSGGMLVTNKLTFGTGSGVSINTVKLDGGEIKASSANADFLNGATAAGGGVHVHDGGVTFNSNGNDIGVAADLIHSTLSGAAATDGGLTKTGDGTLTLAGASTYNGATLVSAGTLLVNGSLGASAVTVENGATFGGSGTIGSNLDLGATSSLQVVDLNNALGVTGTITFGSGFGIANLLGIDWDSVALTSHTIISTSQTFSTSDIANFGFDNRVAVGTLGREAYFTNGSLSVVVIPEPGTALLGGIGMLALLRRRRTA